MTTIKSAVLAYASDEINRAEAVQQCAENLYWNSPQREQRPWELRFMAFQAEGLIDEEFYEEVLVRLRVKQRAWV